MSRAQIGRVGFRTYTVTSLRGAARDLQLGDAAGAARASFLEALRQPCIGGAPPCLLQAQQKLPFGHDAADTAKAGDSVAGFDEGEAVAA